MSTLRLLYKNLLEQPFAKFLNRAPVIYASGIGITSGNRVITKAAGNWDLDGLIQQMKLYSGSAAGSHYPGTVRVPATGPPSSLSMTMSGSVNSDATLSNLAARFDSEQGLIEAAGFPMANLFDGDPSTVWDPGTSGPVDIFLEFDLGAAFSVTAAGLLRPRSHNITAGGIYQFTIASASTYGTWTNRLTVGQPDALRDLSFGGVMASVSARYWRVEINIGERADLGGLWLGVVDQDLGGMPVGTQITTTKPSTLLRSPSGRPFYSQNGPLRRSWRIPWSAMTTARRQQIEAAFDNQGVTALNRYRSCVLIDDEDKWWEVEFENQAVVFTRIFMGVDRTDLSLEEI